MFWRKTPMNMKKATKKLAKNVYAVSPVVATLTLVLASVGTAGALYVWQTGWQIDITDKIGTGNVQANLKVGGSSTVYEFSAVAKEIFEAQNPNYKIELQKGGSGSGIAGAGMGLVDIGAASKDASTDSSWGDYPDLNRDGKKDLGLEMVQHLVGYDGVVVIVDADNTHGLADINEDTLINIYEAVYDGTPMTWGEVPTTHVEVGTVGGTPTTPCNSDDPAEEVDTYDRSDHSGTEECFCEKLLSKGLKDAAKQMDAGYTTFSYQGNQDLVAALAQDPDGIGFTAKGIADNSPGVRVIPFADEDGSGGLATGDGLPSNSEIKSGDWPGSRPLNFITVGQPTGAAKVFIDFCLNTEMNQDICELSDYVSIYA